MEILLGVVGEPRWSNDTLFVPFHPKGVNSHLLSLRTTSRVLYSSNDTPPNLSPVDARVQLLVDESAHRDVLSANEIQAVTDFGTGFFVIWWAYNALNGLAQDKICKLIARQKDAKAQSIASTSKVESQIWMVEYLAIAV
ncbi:MAG: hypothetical protein Q9187_005729 [Circinaria calcarea]